MCTRGSSRCGYFSSSAATILVTWHTAPAVRNAATTAVPKAPVPPVTTTCEPWNATIASPPLGGDPIGPGAGDSTLGACAPSADHAFGAGDVVTARGGDGKHDLDAARDFVERHRRHAAERCGLPRRLARQIGDMQKPAAQLWEPGRGEMH